MCISHDSFCKHIDTVKHTVSRGTCRRDSVTSADVIQFALVFQFLCAEPYTAPHAIKKLLRCSTLQFIHVPRFVNIPQSIGQTSRHAIVEERTSFAVRYLYKGISSRLIFFSISHTITLFDIYRAVT